MVKVLEEGFSLVEVLIALGILIIIFTVFFTLTLKTGLAQYIASWITGG